jgi:hypothetical protein
MRREINLSGGEISILKALGLSGTPVQGKILVQRSDNMEPAELLDVLDGLITIGYVLSSKANVNNIEDVEHGFFRVNPSYARDLRDATRPGLRREEDRTRRRRRG